MRPATKRDGGPWVSHLPDDGVLLSPKVEVFRGSEPAERVEMVGLTGRDLGEVKQTFEET